MTGRLTPAQQRVVDAMRDGAELKNRNTSWWLTEPDGGESVEVPSEIGSQLYWHHAIDIDHLDDAATTVYRLAPAYRESDTPDLAAALTASLEGGDS